MKLMIRDLELLSTLDHMWKMLGCYDFDLGLLMLYFF